MQQHLLQWFMYVSSDECIVRASSMAASSTHRARADTNTRGLERHGLVDGIVGDGEEDLDIGRDIGDDTGTAVGLQVGFLKFVRDDVETGEIQ